MVDPLLLTYEVYLTVKRKNGLFMLIGEIAKSSGLTKASIRHYVDLGLLKPTPRQAGTRKYNDFSDEDLERLKWIELGKKLDFTLAEIGPYLNLFMAGETPDNGWVRLFEGKLMEVDQKITELQSVRNILAGKLGKGT